MVYWLWLYGLLVMAVWFIGYGLLVDYGIKKEIK